jgi:predicted NBD/HSP70 family sugar kinase
LRLQGGDPYGIERTDESLAAAASEFIYRIRDSRDRLTTPAGRRSAAGIVIPIRLWYLGEGAKKQFKSPGAPTAQQP